MSAHSLQALHEVVVQHRTRPHFPASWSSRVVQQSLFPTWLEAHTFPVDSTGPVLVHVPSSGVAGNDHLHASDICSILHYNVAGALLCLAA